MATVSDPSSSTSSTCWTDPYKEFELYLEKANVSFNFSFCFFFLNLFGKTTNLVDVHFFGEGGPI